MKIEGSIEEFKELMETFQIKEEKILFEKNYIDGTKVAQQIAPSVSKVIKNAGG